MSGNLSYLFVDAAHQGNLNDLIDLLSRSVNINTTNSNGETALRMAAYAGHSECLKYLITAGADIHVRGDDNWQAIHMATEQGNLECLKILLEHGADLAARVEPHQMIPLHYAAYHNKMNCVEYLLQQGSDYNAKDFEGKTSYQLAIEQNHHDVAVLISRFITAKEEKFQLDKLINNKTTITHEIKF